MVEFRKPNLISEASSFSYFLNFNCLKGLPFLVFQVSTLISFYAQLEYFIYIHDF